MAYVPTGFTPAEELEVLTEIRAQRSSQKREDIVRGITAVATVVGFFYTLSQFGKLIKERRRSKAVT